MKTLAADNLIGLARSASARAYAPYSGFRVGAALKSASGEVYTASNVENASYGLSVCAERAAVFRAVADGQMVFAALAIYVDADEPAAPCGACLQVLSEFAHDLKIYLASRRRRRVVSLAALLPTPFAAAEGSVRGRGTACRAPMSSPAKELPRQERTEPV